MGVSTTGGWPVAIKPIDVTPSYCVLPPLPNRQETLP